MGGSALLSCFLPLNPVFRLLRSQGSGCPRREMEGEGGDSVRDEPREETGAVAGPHAAPHLPVSGPAHVGAVRAWLPR